MFAVRGRRPVHGTLLVALFLLCYLLCITEDKFKFAMFRLNWHETSVGHCERRGGGGMSSPNALPQVKTLGSSQLLGDLLHLCTSSTPPPPPSTKVAGYTSHVYVTPFCSMWLVGRPALTDFCIVDCCFVLLYPDCSCQHTHTRNNSTTDLMKGSVSTRIQGITLLQTWWRVVSSPSICTSSCSIHCWMSD